MSVPSPQALMLQMSNEVPGILIFRDCYTSFQTHWNQGKSMPSPFVTMQSPSYEGIDEATCVLSDMACYTLLLKKRTKRTPLPPWKLKNLWRFTNKSGKAQSDQWGDLGLNCVTRWFGLFLCQLRTTAKWRSDIILCLVFLLSFWHRASKHLTTCSD